MYRLDHHVGRLLELRFGAITHSDEHREVATKIAAWSKQLGARVVIAADHRQAAHFPPTVAVNIGRGMRAVNAEIERSAILLPHDLLAQQLERIVKTAANPSRRVFQSAAAMKAWLSEVLDDGERARLDAFLGDG